MASDDSEGSRQLRIEQLRRQVDADRYWVPADEVADAVLRFFSRDLPAPDADVSPGSPP